MKLRKKDRITTLVHLADGVKDNARHTAAHVAQMKNNSNKASRVFNAKHADKHAKDMLDHANRLCEHMNEYPNLKKLEQELDGKVF